jgi:glycosyltransferase involved in cell wall biosynthesis
MAMKICYIADGASIHTRRWLNYFASKGYEVHLICWKLMPGFNSDIQVHLLKKVAPKLWPLFEYISFVFWCLQIRGLVKAIKPDIVDGHYVTIYGFLAACSGFHPLVVTAWGDDVLTAPKNNPIFRFMAKFAMRKADRVVCTSPLVKQEISKLGIDLKKIHVIVLGGVDKEKFYPAAKDEVLLEKTGIRPGDPVVISTRGFAAVYDMATLLKAVPLIVSEFPAAKFLIAGKGNQENYLRELAASLGILQNVIFTGWIDHEKLPVYLSSSDIYVSTSLSDGTSNSLLEAMACQLVPVVSDIPANRQWITETENGFFFPIHDYASLAEKVKRLLGNREIKTTLGERNRKLVALMADPETEMKKLVNIYMQLI